jgi:Flp pilus assembly CpaF family ATPase
VPTALDVVDGEVRELIRRRGLDPFTVVRDVLDRVAGFGPLQRYLDDPEIEEIWVNEPGALNALPGGLIVVFSPHSVRGRTQNPLHHASR